MTISTLPPAPQRGTDSPLVFIDKSDAHVESLDLFVTEVNAEVVTINANTQTALDAATSAAVSASSASNSADIAQSNANFKGNWVDLVGALNVPASVFHVGTFWQLLNDLGDVTASEPGITLDWVKIDQSDRITHNVILHYYRSR